MQAWRTTTSLAFILAAILGLGWYAKKPPQSPSAPASNTPVQADADFRPIGTVVALPTATNAGAQIAATPPPLPNNEPDTLLLRNHIGGHIMPEPTQAPLSPAAAVGALIFVDTALSASGKQSCASCHDPALGFQNPKSQPVALGGPNGDQTGTRQVQPLRYVALNPEPAFAIEAIPEQDGGGFEAAGGFFWDGRADSLQAQAREPFLAAHEMANINAAAVIEKVRKRPYFAQLQAIYGPHSFENADLGLSHLGHALSLFQTENTQFAPFNSKFDQYLRGKVQFNPAEQRGLQLFNNPEKGNCIACHPSVPDVSGQLPLFTDFTYDNLGVPRNTNIAANHDPAHYDLGVCQALNSTNTPVAEGFCGAFRVPSLRNVATRSHFFHNGVFNDLFTALQFYVQRDTHPEKWYGKNAQSQVQPFDDLPARYHGNVNRTEVPYNRKLGEQPALNESELRDLHSFLLTLTDADLVDQIKVSSAPKARAKP